MEFFFQEVIGINALKVEFSRKVSSKNWGERRRTPDSLSSKRQRQGDFEVNLASFHKRIENYGIAFCNLRTNTGSVKGQDIDVGRVK